MRVYLFSPIPYTFLHQRPQKIADELRRRSIPVTFVEPYGLTERLADRKAELVADLFKSIALHITAVLRLVFSDGEEKLFPDREGKTPPPGPFEILSLPLVLPSRLVNSNLVEKINAAVYRAWLANSFSGRKQVAERRIALVQHPFFGAVIRAGDFDVTAYDCIDDLSVFSGRGSLPRLAAYEQKICGISDRVFVTSDSLEARIRPMVRAGTPLKVPNGVDADLFMRSAENGKRPPDLPAPGKKIVGYVGMMSSWFDFDLVGILARDFPNVWFVLVGPATKSPGARAALSHANVLFLGRRNYPDIPLYINAFDVCIIPFRQGTIAETTNPVKVFEYLALGKPIVSTWLADIRSLSERGIIRMARSHDEFRGALREALAEDGRKAAPMRRAVAAENSWSERVGLMIGSISG